MLKFKYFRQLLSSQLQMTNFDMSCDIHILYFWDLSFLQQTFLECPNGPLCQTGPEVTTVTPDQVLSSTLSLRRERGSE